MNCVLSWKAYTLTGQLRSVTNAGGYVTRNWHDAMGNVTRSLDSLGKEALTTYDGWGRQLSATQRHSNGTDTITVSTRHDVMGNVGALDKSLNARILSGIFVRRGEFSKE